VSSVGADDRRAAKELVARCEAVGWQVIYSGAGHYKVDTNRGILVIPSTPSGRSMANAVSTAINKFGLADLERKLAETTESDRLSRILADRASNDARLVRAGGVDNPFLPDDEVDTDHGPDLGSVDGVRIVAVAQPMIKTPVMAKPAPIKLGDELLLADGRVLYRCNVVGGAWRADPKADPNLPCHQTFSKPRSLMTHIAFHSQTPEGIHALRSRPNRVNRTRGEEIVTKTDDAIKKIAAAYHGKNDDLGADAARELIITTVEELTNSIAAIGGQMVDVRNTLVKLTDMIRDLKPEVVVADPDPELVAKAARFDALSATLKNLMQ
jgi:hypothetical protein